MTFTLHHLRTGVPSRGHLHIFERQIEKKEKGGNRGVEKGWKEKRRKKIDGEKESDRESEKERKRK